MHKNFKTGKSKYIKCSNKTKQISKTSYIHFFTCFKIIENQNFTQQKVYENGIFKIRKFKYFRKTCTQKIKTYVVIFNF